jgi:8-oxo-dGTP pyrophosphatase MutT (NUDIX family)
MTSMPPAPALDAASLLLLRDGLAGPQVYMVRRHSRSPFLPNAHVFVGGRLDGVDLAPELQACCRGRSAADAAARLELDGPRAVGLYVAAIRECFEEAGVLLACSEQSGDAPLPPTAALEAMRRRLVDEDAPLAALLAEHGLVLPLDRLRYLDRWLTPEIEPRRYDTRFFVCRAPEEQQPSWDTHEMSAGGWLTVEDALQRNLRRELMLAPPTLTLLERLRGQRSVQEILAVAPDAPVPCTLPRLLSGAEQPVLLLLGDHRYDDATSAAGPEHYVVLHDGRWERVCTLE